MTAPLGQPAPPAWLAAVARPTAGGDLAPGAEAAVRWSLPPSKRVWGGTWAVVLTHG